MLSVADRIRDDIFKENLEDTLGLLIDKPRDALDTTMASKTADSWFGDTLDVIMQNYIVMLGTSLSNTLGSFCLFQSS